MSGPALATSLAVVTTLEDAQAALRKLAAVLRAAGAGHAGLHDLLLMYASVQVRGRGRQGPDSCLKAACALLLLRAPLQFGQALAIRIGDCYALGAKPECIPDLAHPLCCHCARVCAALDRHARVQHLHRAAGQCEGCF